MVSPDSRGPGVGVVLNECGCCHGNGLKAAQGQSPANQTARQQRGQCPGNKLNVDRRLGVFAAEVKGHSGFDEQKA